MQAGCDLVLWAAVIFSYLWLVPRIVCLFKSGNIPAIKYYLVVNKGKSEDDLEQIQNGSNGSKDVGNENKEVTNNTRE